MQSEPVKPPDRLAAVHSLALLLAGFLVLYLWNLAPDITWEDSATYHKLLADGDAPWGEAVSHRLFFLVTGAVLDLPLPGDPAWKLNLLNALISIRSLGLVFAIVLLLTRRTAAATLATAALGVSHLFWHYAEVTKPYPLMNLLWLYSLVRLLRGANGGKRSAFFLAGLCQALSLGVHPYAAAFLPASAVFLALTRGPRLRTACAWLAGWLPGVLFVLLLYRDLIGEMGWPRFAWHWAFGGQGELVTGMSQGSELISFSWKRFGTNLAEWFAYLVYQFPLTLPLAALGLSAQMKRDRAAGWALLVFYVSCIAVPFDFNVPLKINFYLPGFLVVAIWIGCGLEPFLARLAGGSWTSLLTARRACLAAALTAPPLLYAATAFGPGRELLPELLRKEADTGYKDRIRFYLWPGKYGFDEPRRYAERAFAAAGRDAVVIVDFQERDVLRYYQEEMKRGDLAVHHLSAWGGEESRPAREMFLKWAAEAAGDRPLYLGRVYRPLWEGSGWTAEPAGDLDRIRR